MTTLDHLGSLSPRLPKGKGPGSNRTGGPFQNRRSIGSNGTIRNGCLADDRCRIGEFLLHGRAGMDGLRFHAFQGSGVEGNVLEWMDGWMDGWAAVNTFAAQGTTVDRTVLQEDGRTRLFPPHQPLACF
eukprot:scaffold360_cov374-Pavlova_lutheri.AAC.76